MEVGLLLHSIFAYPIHGVWRSFCGTYFCFLPHGKQQISNHIQNKVEVMEAKNNPYSRSAREEGSSHGPLSPQGKSCKYLPPPHCYSQDVEWHKRRNCFFANPKKYLVMNKLFFIFADISKEI